MGVRKQDFVKTALQTCYGKAKRGHHSVAGEPASRIGAAHFRRTVISDVQT